nr:sodium-coupled monocarboxylate transporter 1-like [Ciona intestinalis]XP_026695018.1 sodium-coupled monocarboxylate transporter 1-like [Ciona intestinalis]XP_026695019.1 sodium-coupled monocarboxylate transporter 1-like [Ciona intestinalis]|eukprot:XP_002119750.3 sodium-coupled monocarboxylate transporter 1-like [Ciona intestinalis]
MTSQNSMTSHFINYMTSSFEAITSEATLAPKIKNTFHAVDYVMFVIMLLTSAAIGVFFALKDRRKSELTPEDYLMAGRQMSYGPVAMSLIASFMSSVTILGAPVEYYVYGTMFTWYALVYAIVPFIIGWVFMPVFYDLGISSTYEYLEMRFNRPVRLFVTSMYMFLSLIYGGIVIYGPALALSETTGFDLWVAILTTGVVCIFYTVLGGLKAVIWTDVFQAIIMIIGFLAVIIQGSINLGGFGVIWESAYNGGRIDFVNFEFDPRIRHTFWSIMFGGSIFWLGINGVNQAQVQRYVCCRTKREAKKAILWNAFGLVIILVLAGMTGLTIYATYKDCDPIDSKQIGKSDQLFPFIVMDILGKYPGIPGLFVAGVYSSSLSTISSGMNAMACVALEDFIRPYTNWRPRTYTILSKVLVLVSGVLYILLAYMASVIGGLIRMAYSIHGIVSGPIVGVFTMGMLMPFTNKWGALSGIIAGFASTVWIFIGSVIYPIPSEFFRILPRTTEGCPAVGSTLNQTYFTSTASLEATTSDILLQTTYDDRPPIADLYAMSYIYIPLFGFVNVILVGSIVSALTGCTKGSPPKRELLCHLFFKDDDGKNLERSSSWYSPSDVAHAQVISPPQPGEFTGYVPVNTVPDIVITSDESLVAEKESSF